MNTTQHPDMTWWREARFGMFIHWGLYSIPAGEWKEPVNIGSSEWIMNRARIPVRDYEKLAAQFNPVEFDADGIAKLAEDAGMKYLVITAKHHEGFAMFKSNASPYNVVDGTPFGRDIIGELAEACGKRNIRFGVYYSQALDWHHPDAAGNDWDWPDEDGKDFKRFLDDKVYPQVDELLSNYGPMSVLWFDTPAKITAEQSRDLLEFVRSKQPECIVNSRLGPGGGSEWGDFVSLRDNEVPTVPLTEDGETCATINGNWGYNKFDLNYRPAGKILRLLADVVAKNANYLLNIGPDSLGRVPEGSVEVLHGIGRWLETNGESIYETGPTPFPGNLEWGAVTARPGRLYFHMFDLPGSSFTIRGLKNEAQRAYYLDAPETSLPVKQQPVSGGQDLLDTVVEAGASSGGSDAHRVLALDIDGTADVQRDTVQQPDGSVTLESLLAKDAETGGPIAPLIMDRGAVARSLAEGMRLAWTFEILEPGAYEIVADCATGRYTDHGGKKVVDTGHEVVVEVNGETIPATIREDARQPVRGNAHWMCITSGIGTVQFDKPGRYPLTLNVGSVKQGDGGGFVLRNVKLSRV